jgi:hypothetical protein
MLQLNETLIFCILGGLSFVPRVQIGYDGSSVMF